MSYLELDGDRYKIPPGEAVIGSDASSFLVLTGAALAARHAIFVVTADGQVSVRRVSEESPIFINGVRLGPQPVPLLHGDKIEIAGQELTFVDERRSGSTQFVSAADIAKLQELSLRPAARRKATAGTGGRLVSLTDGREYAIEGSSLVFGREAICDVVVPQKRVSRRHAEIIVTPKGYVVTDMSSNGTFVNGERIVGQRLLSRADVVRVGDHEFRFYADAAVQPEPVAPQPAARSAAAGAEYRLSDTLHGVPATPRPPGFGAGAGAGAPAAPPAAVPGVPSPSPITPAADSAPGPEPVKAPEPSPPQPEPRRRPPPPSPAVRGTLANLIVRKGRLKGHRFPIRVPIVNVGRAEYNDIVVPDPSVSTAHAKIQLREGIWMVVDLDSTNGTFVDGDRVSGDAPIAPGAVLRFGEVSVVFESTKDDSVKQGGGTQVLGAINPLEE
jgi:pSer/pThr/pTyr-binding forkhead associated (FHA) protein